MVPLAVSKIITQVDRILASAADPELEPQLTVEEVGDITVHVGTSDEPLINYRHCLTSRVRPDPGVDGEVSARSEVQGRIGGNGDAVVSADTHGQTDLTSHKHRAVLQGPVVRAVNIIGIIFD